MTKQFKVGQHVLWTTNEFDGKQTTKAIITEIHDDYALAKADDMTLWIDSDTENDFVILE